MGQYHYVVSIDSEEYLHPHDLGSGLKALEIASTNIPQLVQYLTTQTTGGGGGDFHVSDVSSQREETYFGRWAGDRVIYAGDYDESLVGLDDVERQQARAWFDLDYEEQMRTDLETVAPQGYVNAYQKAETTFENISEPAKAAYNDAVDSTDLMIRDRPHERDATVDVVGTHPENPTTLARDVDYQDGREAATTYSREYGFEYVVMHERDPDV